VRKTTLLLIWIGFTALNVFLSFNYHSHAPRHSYHGSLWADRAGYYVYLPATFQYGFTASSFPDGSDTLTGSGFKLDIAANTVRTKYTAGVAMVQAPFYLVIHGVGALAGIEEAAFEDLDHIVVSIAGPVMAALGLLFLYSVFAPVAGPRPTLFLLLALYAGTNLFYYAVCDPGMSHVHSFFLFSSLLFLIDRALQRRHISFGTTFIVGVVCGLILLIRPTNLMFIIALLIMNAARLNVSGSLRISLDLVRHLAVLVLAASIVWLPQMLYWEHAFGSFVTWPYSGEGFSNWPTPEIGKFLFSTNNGLIPYAPIILVMLFGMTIQWRSGERLKASASLFALVAVVIIGASWWVWHFGCGFGSRTMVEFMALFASALFAFHSWMTKHGRKVPSAILLSVLIVLQLKMTYSYGNCWFHGDWNWPAYGELIFGPTK
jgi:hypothetical protein